MYKAEVEITDHTQSGWDNYVDTETVLLVAETVSNLKQQIEDLNMPDRTGDFGLCIASRDVKVLKSWEVVQKEVVKPLVL